MHRGSSCFSIIPEFACILLTEMKTIQKLQPLKLYVTKRYKHIRFMAGPGVPGS